MTDPALTDADGAAGDDRDVLLAVDREGDRRGGDRGAEGEAPELLERLSIIDGDLAAHVAGGKDAAVSREHAGLGWRLELDLVDDLAGLEVHRPERAMGGDAALLGAARRQADIVLLLVHRRLACGRGDAALGARDIGDAALGVERRREKGRRAVPPRTGL